MGISSTYVNIQVKVGTLMAIRTALGSGGLADKVTKVLDALTFECDECKRPYHRNAFPEETVNDEFFCWDCALKAGQMHVEDLEANREGMVEPGRSEMDEVPTLD
jgi:hypothetical protein